MSICITRIDILVIGAGLAGFTAALSARKKSPDVDITLVSVKASPHGSSFYNSHNQLGIQVCLDEKEKFAFIREAQSIALPGEVDTRLVQILAEDSLTAFLRLGSWGAQVKKDSRSRLVRVKGCFSPVQPRAYLLTGMRDFFYRLKRVALGRGIIFMGGWRAEDIQTRAGRFRVGLKHRDDEKSERIIEAKAVILACGGRAGLFGTTLSGAGNAPGFIHSWCEKKKIPYVNRAYTQFVWCIAGKPKGWDICQLAHEGARLRYRDGRSGPVPDHLHPFFKIRATHAPMAYGFEDRAIDALLLENRNEDGRAEVFHPRIGWIEIELAAQASNGGIRVDENGFTGLEGLYACGEAAGGMHGANRIGGAMVLSCLVFGNRAGNAAAESISRNSSFC